jgi:Lrp/AsnC family transcriptional regulator
MNENTIKIDKLDRKILYELDNNARQSLSSLSKKLRASRSVIDYRIRQLQKKGVIKNFVTLLDAGRLGLMIWNVYLEFQNLNKNVEKEIVDYLVNNKRVWWVAKTAGKWDMIYSIFVKDIKEFYNIVTAFQEKYGKYISNQSLAAHVEVEVFSRGYFLDKPSEGVTWYKEFFSVKLSETDKKILSELAKNARAPSTEIARKLNITPRMVAYRIKNLIKSRVITRFRLQLDVTKLGYSFYKTILYTKDFSKEKDKALMEYCRRLGNVFHYEKKIGPWILELEMDVESYEKFNEILREMKEYFPDFIRSYEGVLVYDEPKGELDLTQYLKS